MNDAVIYYILCLLYYSERTVKKNDGRSGKRSGHGSEIPEFGPDNDTGVSSVREAKQGEIMSKFPVTKFPGALRTGVLRNCLLKGKM